MVTRDARLARIRGYISGASTIVSDELITDEQIEDIYSDPLLGNGNVLETAIEACKRIAAASAVGANTDQKDVMLRRAKELSTYRLFDTSDSAEPATPSTSEELRQHELEQHAHISREYIVEVISEELELDRGAEVDAVARAKADKAESDIEDHEGDFHVAEDRITTIESNISSNTTNIDANKQAIEANKSGLGDKENTTDHNTDISRVEGKADSGIAKADAAQKTADSARNTATTANATANATQTELDTHEASTHNTDSTAREEAQRAKSAADTASGEASSALTVANQAKTTADAANAKADRALTQSTSNEDSTARAAAKAAQDTADKAESDIEEHEDDYHVAQAVITGLRTDVDRHEKEIDNIESDVDSRFNTVNREITTIKADGWVTEDRLSTAVKAKLNDMGGDVDLSDYRTSAQQDVIDSAQNVNITTNRRNITTHDSSYHPTRTDITGIESQITNANNKADANKSSIDELKNQVGTDSTARAGVLKNSQEIKELENLTSDLKRISHTDWVNNSRIEQGWFQLEGINDGDPPRSGRTIRTTANSKGPSDSYIFSVGIPQDKDIEDFRITVNNVVVADHQWSRGADQDTFKVYENVGGIELLPRGGTVRIQRSTRTYQTEYEGDVPETPTRDNAPVSKKYFEDNKGTSTEAFTPSIVQQLGWLEYFVNPTVIPDFVDKDQLTGTYSINFTNSSVVTGDVWYVLDVAGFGSSAARKKFTPASAILTIPYTLSSDDADTLAISLARNNSFTLQITFFDAATSGNEVGRIRYDIAIVRETDLSDYSTTAEQKVIDDAQNVKIKALEDASSSGGGGGLTKGAKIAETTGLGASGTLTSHRWRVESAYSSVVSGRTQYLDFIKNSTLTVPIIIIEAEKNGTVYSRAVVNVGDTTTRNLFVDNFESYTLNIEASTTRSMVIDITAASGAGAWSGNKIVIYAVNGINFS